MAIALEQFVWEADQAGYHWIDAKVAFSKAIEDARFMISETYPSDRPSTYLRYRPLVTEPTLVPNIRGSRSDGGSVCSLSR